MGVERGMRGTEKSQVLGFCFSTCDFVLFPHSAVSEDTEFVAGSDGCVRI